MRWVLAWCFAAHFLGAQPISVALDKPVLSLNPLILAREVEVQVADLVFDRLVALDEHESGIRATLNLGHTFGHAIETGMGYGAWLHGEAVAAGMVMAADLSQRLGWLQAPEMTRIESLMQRARLPCMAPRELSSARFREIMAVDKKVLDGKLRLVLLKGIGHAVVTSDFSPGLLDQTLKLKRAAA